jgi:uncharacterized tellurite resistance protein B-like protein
MLRRMFSRKPSAKLTGTDLLREAVREHMSDADETTQRLVVAVCGLLATVAYADRQYVSEERARVREALSSVQGLSPAGVDAVCEVLDTQILELATINPQLYTRELRQLGEVSLRREVLDLLIDLAASDDTLTLGETDLLRRTGAALGLSSDDYVHAQSRHRDKLQMLKARDAT